MDFTIQYIGIWMEQKCEEGGAHRHTQLALCRLHVFVTAVALEYQTPDSPASEQSSTNIPLGVF
jgi:hypothetical protein